MIALILISVVIFSAGVYSGALTYLKLKEYLDLAFKIQKTDNKTEGEEYGIEMAKVSSDLIPWSLAYILCVVLFIIVLYNLTT